MNVRDYLLFSWLSYIDLPPLYSNHIGKGGELPVAVFADAVLRLDAQGHLECVKLNDAAREAARELCKSDAVITGYINENAGDGFVAYIIRNGGETVAAMRGSETVNPCVPSNIDWADNICEPFSDSVQRPSIERMLEMLPEGPVTLTGHSKGGHNALYALALSEGENVRAAAFNAQGFSADALTDKQKARLDDRGVNYVVASDVIGAMLSHPERRVYVRQKEGTQAHMPEAFMFDEYGQPLLQARAPISLLSEGTTRAIDGAVKGRMRRRVGDVCKALVHRGGY